MRRFIILLIFVQAFLLSQNITAVEYFIDSDPGRGLGTAISFTADSVIDLSANVDLSAVSEGIHTLYIRIKDENDAWSIAFSRVFVKKSASNVNLTNMEYFVDTDPGRGSASAISMTPSDTIETNFTADLSALSEGLHTVYMRAKDANNKWSLAFSRSFIKKTVSSGNLNFAEYFIDSDPGRASATELSFSANDTVSIDALVDISSVSEGLHTLYLRTRDTGNNWSIAYSRVFIKKTISSGNINYAEYFIDSDPGRGLATSISFSPTDTLNIAAAIDLSAVSDGIHSLYLRTRDEDNNWSLAFSRAFIKSSANSSKISEIKYSFVKDTAILGSELSFTDFTAADSITAMIDLDLSSLALGDYMLRMEAVNESGERSLPYVADFSYIITDTPTVANPIADIDVSEDFDTVKIDLASAFEDDFTSDDKLFFSITNSDLVMDTILGTELRISAIKDRFGSDSLFVSARDEDSQSITDTVILNIHSVNDYPFVENPQANISIDEDFASFDIDLATIFDDVETNDANLLFTQSGANLVTASLLNSTLTISSQANVFGVDTLIFKAEDDSSATVMDTVIFSINPVNDAPTIVNPLADIHVDEDFDTLRLSLASVFSDIEDSELVYTISGENLVELSLVDTLLSIISKVNVFGLDTLFIKASDSESAFVTDTVLLQINSIDDFPAKITDLSAQAGDGQIQLTWTASSEANISRYQLFRAESNDSLQAAKIDSLTTNQYTDQNVSNGVSYFYWLKVVTTDELTSAFSNVASATPILTPLNTSLYIFQNSALESSINIILNADSNLLTLPEIVLSQSTETDTLSVRKINNSNRNFSAAFSLKSSGQFTVNSHSQSVNGEIDDETRNFTATLSKANIATEISTGKPKSKINVKKGSFDRNIIILAEENTEAKSYLFKPELESKVEMRLQLAFEKGAFLDPSKLFIYQKIDSEWKALESQVFAKDRTVVSYIQRLGEYRIAYNKDFEGSNLVPEQFQLEQNFPNPFNPITQIQYDLANDGQVKLLVYNLLGQKVRTLVNEFQRAGTAYKQVWDGRNDRGEKLASGIYFYQLISERFVKSKKMILLK